MTLDTPPVARAYLVTLLFALLVFPLAAPAQSIITTVAGGGVNSPLATTAILSETRSVAVDALGNIFIAGVGMPEVFKVDSKGNFTVVAGNGTFGFSGDGGAATSASLGTPGGVAVDSAGNLFISDDVNSVVRRVDASTGIITTVAGGGSGCAGQTDLVGDGCPATSASLYLVASADLAVDGSGNLVIADTIDDCVRRVDATTGIITTVAGMCAVGAGFGGDGGPATSASLNYPYGVAVDASGNLFIADFNNYRIRSVAAATGVITTVAGNGTYGFSGDGGAATRASLNGPTGVAVDGSDNLLIADLDNNRIRRVAYSSGIITTVAGTGTPGLSGDGGAATSASLNYPYGVAVDATGNLFIADTYNNRIRSVAAATGIINTAVGGGSGGDGAPATFALLATTYGVAADSSGNLFIADSWDSRIRRVDASTGTITTVAGNGTYGFTGDGGPATSAGLSYPTGVAVDSSGNLLIADAFNQRIRRVDASTGTIATVAGDGTAAYSGDGEAATSASLNYPYSVAVDSSGNLFVADTHNNVIRRVDVLTGIITTVAGNGTAAYSGDGGIATSASLNTPWGVAVDNSDNLFVSDGINNRIRRVDASTGIITTVAGNGTAGFSGDGGAATSASLSNPAGVAVDSADNLFFADGVGLPYPNTSQSRIRRVDASTGIITTVAGNGTEGYGGDGGPATSASLNDASGVAVDSSGDLFIADTYSDRIREVTSTSAVMITTSSLNFGNQAVGTPSAAQTVTLTNSGGAALTVTSVTTNGTNNSDFTQSDNCVSSSPIAPGGTCTISVTFTPSEVGPETATLEVTDNAPSSPQTVSLTGTGTGPVIASLNPSTATAGGAAFTLTVNGTGFVSGAQVQWNGTPLASSTFVNPTELTAQVAASLIATAGTAAVTVVENGVTSNSVSFTITTPVLSGATLTPLPATSTPAQQYPLGVTLNAPAATQVNGALTLTFQADPSVLYWNSGYSGAQFSSGCANGTADNPNPNPCTANFTIAANGTTATFLNASGQPVSTPFMLSVGTVAGKITVTLTQNGVSLPPSTSVTVPPAPPISLKSVINPDSDGLGFTVLSTGYSNTRSLQSATFNFSGSGLTGTTSFAVNIQSAAQTYFQGASGLQNGGSFQLSQHFAYTGPTNVLDGLTVAVPLVDSENSP
jgi:hypothetical protein